MHIPQHWTLEPPLGVSINWSHPLAKGLVGCWLFNEGSGDKVYDLSGNSYTGTLIALGFPPTVTYGWNPGSDGRALKFDGGARYVSVGANVLEMAGEEEVSVCVRATVDDASDYRPLVVRGWTNDRGYEVRVEKTAGTAIIIQGESGSFKWCLGTTPIHDGARHDVVGTFGQDDKLRIYIDGVEENSADGFADIPPTPGLGLFFGMLHGAYYHKGTIDWVFVYNRALPPQQVNALHENPYGMFNLPLMWSVDVPPPPTRIPRPPAVSGVPSAHF